MAWNVGAFGANAWNYGEVTVPVTSTSAIGTTALGNETVVEGTGVTFGVTSTGLIATGYVGEEVVWFEIPTNTFAAADYGIISTSGATGSWENIIG